MAASLAALRERAGRFTATYTWLVRLGLVGQRGSTVLIIVAGVIGAAAQGGAIAALLAFMRLVDTTGETESDGGGVLGNNLTSLLLVAGVLVSLLAISAAAEYFAAARGRAVGRRCHHDAAQRIIELLASRPDLGPVTDEFDPADVRQLVGQVPRLMGIALESVIRLLRPITYATVFLGSLVLLDPVVTLLLVPLALLPAPFLYLHNARVRRMAREFYGGASRGVARTTNECFRTLNAATTVSAARARAVGRHFETSEDARRFFDAFDHMRLAATRSILITSIFRPVFLVAILLVMGSRALDNPVSWPEVLTYLVVLLRLVNQGETIMASFAMLNRYYPQAIRYRRFTNDVRPFGDPPPAGDLTVTHEKTEHVIRSGETVLLVQPRSLDLFQLPRITRPLAEATRPVADGRRWTAAAFVTSRAVPIDITLASHVFGSDAVTDEQRAQVLAAVEDLGERAAFDALPDGLATRLDGDAWRATSSRLRLVSRLLPFAFGPDPVVLVDGPLISDDDARRLALLGDRTCVVVTTNPEFALPDADHVLASDGRHLTFAGTWDDWRARDDRDTLARDATGDAAAVDDDDLDDDL